MEIIHINLIAANAIGAQTDKNGTIRKKNQEFPTRKI